MAVLTTQQRADVTAEFMAQLSADGQSCSALKSEVRAAVDAADDYQNTNAASYNTALPVGFRTKATNAQKSLVFNLVSKKRYGTGA